MFAAMPKHRSPPKFTFQLVAEIGRLIVKEFDGFSVGKAVCKVDILAHKRVELFPPWASRQCADC